MLTVNRCRVFFVVFAGSQEGSHKFKGASFTRSSSRALLNPVFGWEGSPTKIDFLKKVGYTYSNLSAGEPSLGEWTCTYTYQKVGELKISRFGSHESVFP